MYITAGGGARSWLNTKCHFVIVYYWSSINILELYFKMATLQIKLLTKKCIYIYIIYGRMKPSIIMSCDWNILLHTEGGIMSAWKTYDPIQKKSFYLLLMLREESFRANTLISFSFFSLIMAKSKKNQLKIHCTASQSVWSGISSNLVSRRQYTAAIFLSRSFWHSFSRLLWNFFIIHLIKEIFFYWIVDVRQLCVPRRLFCYYYYCCRRDSRGISFGAEGGRLTSLIGFSSSVIFLFLADYERWRFESSSRSFYPAVVIHVPTAVTFFHAPLSCNVTGDIYFYHFFQLLIALPTFWPIIHAGIS